MDTSNHRGKFVIVTDNGEVIALWDNTKYCYNPNKLKISDIKNYDCYEVINNLGSVVPKRDNRQELRKGYTDLMSVKASYNKPPKSTRYVFDRDWNPEVNREYYTKLLHQNKLGKYAEQLDYAYTVMEDLINHRRKEQTIGKRGVYTSYVKKMADQMDKCESLINALDKNMNPDIPKLIKSLKTLENITKDANELIGYEDDAIATFGYTKQRPHAKIER